MPHQPPKPLITIIGSLNIDYVTTTPHCPKPGETLTATSLTITPGGKGSNQAVGCGKASFVSPREQDIDVEMVGSVGGGDVYVETLLFPMLRDAGVGVDGVRVLESSSRERGGSGSDGGGVQTGTATIIVETELGKGENRILVVPGANYMGMDDVREVIARVERVCRGRVLDVVLMQGEIPRVATLELLRYFNGVGGTKVVFNPAPVFPRGIPLDALLGLEVLVVNETEAVLLGRSLVNDGFDVGGVNSEEDLSGEDVLGLFAGQFHSLAGVKIVLVTLGARGVYYSVSGGDVEGLNVKSGLVPGVKVDEVVDTTAAGDTFVGYFAAGLARHIADTRESGSGGEFEIENVVRKANAAAAKCVQRAGAMQSIPFGYE